VTATDPPALRDLLAEIVASGLFGSADGLRVADVRVLAVSNHDLRAIVDALLADPRIAVVALSEVTAETSTWNRRGGDVMQRTIYTTAWQPVSEPNHTTTTEGNPS